MSFSFRGNHAEKRTRVKHLQISTIGVFVCTLKICSYFDRMAAVKVQLSEDLKILFENSLLRLSSHVANGMFKEDKVEQQLLLFQFFWMLAILGGFFLKKSQ